MEFQENVENELRQRKLKKQEGEELNEDSSVVSTKVMSGIYPNYVGYGFVSVIFILVKLLTLYQKAVPTQLTLEDETYCSERFIGKRAEVLLEKLSSLGPRVVGSYENEVLAVDFFKREVSLITQEAHKSQKIEIDVQRPTGSYFLLMRPYGFRNYYANIQNIVVKLHSKNSKNSVLINCHYDTVPESPGASDNGLNCVVMLEILRVLSKRKIPLKHNVIFLFNGAEENPLQASHGFLAQHKWKKEVKVVINLDSAGAGGKEILFQTSGNPSLIKAYIKSAPHPYASVIAEELFQFGIIPSDTDFRNFRDFGNYSGFDFAHTLNGYVYHTKYDKMDYIRPGVYQHTGDNMLALLKELADSDQLEWDYPAPKLVYFDVFQLMTILYTENFAFELNMITVLLSAVAVCLTYRRISAIYRKRIKALLITIVVQILSILLCGVVAIAVALIIDHYQSTLSWYPRPWLLIPIYIFPMVFAIGITLECTSLTHIEKINDPPGYKIIRFLNGIQLIWSTILFAATIRGIRSSFLLMLFILPPSLGIVIMLGFKKVISVRSYLAVYMVPLIFTITYMIYQCVQVLSILTPMAGRMGPHKSPEITMGGLCYGSTLIILTYVVPFIFCLKKSKTFLITLLLAHFITLSIVVGTNLTFPYDGNLRNPALQRFYVLHCERTMYDTKGVIRKADSGFFLQSMDRNNINYISKIIPELKTAKSLFPECQSELYCGFPIFTSRFIDPAPYSYVIPALQPIIHHPTFLEVLNQTQISTGVRRIYLLVSGPDHITTVISPQADVELCKWSFDEFKPIENQKWGNRKTFMVYYSHGLMGGNLAFYIDLEVPSNHTGFIMDVAVAGHYMHDQNFRTEEFTNFLSKFPDWAHVTPWTATFKSWRI